MNEIFSHKILFIEEKTMVLFFQYDFFLYSYAEEINVKKKWLRPFCYSLKKENIITIESFQVQVHGIYLKKKILVV